MKNLTRKLLPGIIALIAFSSLTTAQRSGTSKVSENDLIAIVKAEDELRFDNILLGFLKNSNPRLQKRAAQAAGRIGDEAAIPALEELLEKEVPEVNQAAVFALGEIESIKAADSILKILGDYEINEKTRGSAIEAAGKIAAANSSDDEAAKKLGDAILFNLAFEAGRRSRPSTNVIILGITAALRAKPENADQILVKFLGYSDWRIRADALNSLSRLRSALGNDKAFELLKTDEDPIVRANAARVLGTSEDKNVLQVLINAATNDPDHRVRINAIRSLGSLKDAKSADVLIIRAEKVFAAFKTSKYRNPIEENELLTISVALGDILGGTNDAKSINFLQKYRVAKNYSSPEIDVAIMKISPKSYFGLKADLIPNNSAWKQISTFAAAYDEFSKVNDKPENKDLDVAPKSLMELVPKDSEIDKIGVDLTLAIPNLINAYAEFDPDGLAEDLYEFLKYKDFAIRVSAATLLGEIKPESPANAIKIYRALSDALWEARLDISNDASIAILDALKKQYENRPDPMPIKVAYMTPFISAMKSPDYLIRRKAAEIYRSFNIPKPDPMTVGDPNFKPFEIPEDIGIVKFDETDENGARSRVVRADYKRAVSRKNGQWKAILETEKGTFSIDLFPEDAPLTVENFVKLANAGYFNGLEIHRVVPNFVMQDGDPRGDGNGGPGWQIRCEINQVRYERGAVGMALSGKDTGGSQWFVTHSRQPHLDGGYTVFGRVNEAEMKIVDALVRGDKIISVKILMAGLVKAK